MKDRVFSGRDVGQALAEAAASLGRPAASLRYVVLDAGSPGGRGLNPTPATIAVLADGAHAGRAPDPAPPDPEARLRGLVTAVAEAAGVSVGAALEMGPGDWRLRLSGELEGLLLEQEGEVLRALEHLLQRAVAGVGPARLRLECEGYRERRDAQLAARARELAGAVRRDGAPRELPPLNAYERRVVHLALAEEPGVRSYSVGEDPDRRVTIAPAESRG